MSMSLATTGPHCPWSDWWIILSLRRPNSGDANVYNYHISPAWAKGDKVAEDVVERAEIRALTLGLIRIYADQSQDNSSYCRYCRYCQFVSACNLFDFVLPTLTPAYFQTPPLPFVFNLQLARTSEALSFFVHDEALRRPSRRPSPPKHLHCLKLHLTG